MDKNGSGLIIRLPTDVTTSLDWEAGMELIASIEAEDTLRLRKE